MRIIGGTLRGRRIAAPEGRSTRPMLDRVREAVFSTVAAWVADGNVLDLFAGSGSLGLEALSRGASAARLIEQDPKALALLAENVARLGVEEHVDVVQGDALDPSSWGPSGAFDLVFLDPPYALLDGAQTRPDVLAALAGLVEHALAPDGMVVLHTRRPQLSRGALPAGLVASERTYGTNAIWYLQPAGEESA